MMRPVLHALLLGLLALGLASCDTVADDLTSVTFDGVTYSALGGATLEPTSAGLAVGRGTATDEYGVRVDLADDASLTGAAFHVLPVDLLAGSRWGLQLFGDLQDTRTAVATVWNEAVDDSTHQIVLDFDLATGATTVTFQYFLNGQLLLSVPDLPLSSTGGRLRTPIAGEGLAPPQSVHVTRDGSRYVVATDFGGPQPLGGCAGILLHADLPDFPADGLCTDYVQAIPDAFYLPGGPTGVEIRARVPLDGFTLTSGDVEDAGDRE